MSLAQPPDLVVLDLMMPRRNGVEALLDTRAQRGYQQVPVAVLTSTHDTQLIEQARQLCIVQRYFKSASNNQLS